MNNNDFLPYGDIFIPILKSINKGLSYVYNEELKGREVSIKDEKFNRIFRDLTNIAKQGKNKHLVKGLSLTEQKREKVYPRIGKLILNSYKEIKKTKNQTGIPFPSPLKILYNLLTVPEEPQTASYAFILIRTNLFKILGIHPYHKDLYESSIIDMFNESDIIDSLVSLKNYINQQARWPDSRIKKETTTSRIHYLNGNILAVKGVTYLWFASSKEINKFLKNDFHSLNDLSKIYCDPRLFRFRLSTQYEELPDYSEIINWIFGIPIPIRGADILFYGALKKSRSSGLVMNLHGLPGAGKTTAALAFSAVMAPFNTTTFYISLEEGIDDLESKLSQLIPSYLKDLNVYPQSKTTINGKNQKLDWFNPVRLDSNLNIQQLTEILNLIQSEIVNVPNGNKVHNNYDYLPSVCPLIIVIDNINELFVGIENSSDYYENLENFIAQCRSMDAIVILVAADSIPKNYNLDYLVDVSIRLEQRGVFDRQEKPERILQLLKTRQQISRQGSHIFHLSSSKGFRISPQVPSQLDRRQIIKRLLPDATDLIQTLNITRVGGKIEFEKYLDIRSRSQILIHGHGSSGKAGFGLKILLSPTTKKSISNLKQLKNGKISSRKKVLVLSFLYPKEYYKILFGRIINQFKDIYDFDDKDLSYQVLAFYAGYLAPEDFVYKIIRTLEEAKLEGESFTGVLIDGLHNVFLQFKMLQESHMVWPLLYNILSRYGLTVVSTFTNFTVDDDFEGRAPQYSQDHLLIQQGQKPFLHGLVKASDYYFVLSQYSKDDEAIKYVLTTKASIVNPPPHDLYWNRQGIHFEKNPD